MEIINMIKFRKASVCSFLLIAFLSACTVESEEKKVLSTLCPDLKLQVLGSGGPEIDDGLASSSFLIWIEKKAVVMIDAGGGSSLNFEKSGVNFNDLQAILLTHLHVDHSAALPIYIKAGYFTGRESLLSIYGPAQGGDFPSTEDFISALFSDQQKSAYPYLSDNFRQQPSTDFLMAGHSVSSNNQPWSKKLSEQLSISAINVEHGAIPAIAWRVDYRGCSITFSGDMNGESGNLKKIAKETNLLVANNAIPQQSNRFAKALHMTPQTIGMIASKAKVKKLLLAHFMNRTNFKKKETILEIKKNYKGEIILSEDLMIVFP